MPRPLRSSERRFVFALSDCVSATVAVALALWTWSLTAGVGFSADFLRTQAVWFTAVPLWVLALSPTRHASAALDLQATSRGLWHATGALFVAYLAAYFYVGPEVLPRLMAVYVLWNAAWLTLGGRLALLWTLTHDAFARRLLIVGDAPATDVVLALMKTPGMGDASVVGVVRPSDDIFTLTTDLSATEVVIAPSATVPASMVEELLRCHEAGVDVVPFVQVYEHTLRRVPVRNVGPDWLLTQLFAGAGARDSSPIAKRLIDLVTALVFGVAGTILGAVAAVAIVIESGRPVFYSQVRLGRGGRPFRLTKFRTMAVDAEREGPQWSPENDPRITRVGRVLRRTHLDELPNLWAVLRGDMSMVGPRPERPEFVAVLEQQVPLYRARLTATPGLTGWAQVRMDYGDSIDAATLKLEFDLYYIRHQSLWFDLTILARTAGRMFGWKGR